MELQRPEAGRSGRSEVRRDGLQGVFRRAVDVHILKQEHGIVRCFWGKQNRNIETPGAENNPDDAAEEDFKLFYINEKSF